MPPTSTYLTDIISSGPKEEALAQKRSLRTSTAGETVTD
jgi:hypothetical protein